MNNKTVTIIKITQHFQKYMIRELNKLKITKEESLDIMSGILANLTALHVLQQHEIDGQNIDYLYTQFGEVVKTLLHTYVEVRKN